MTVSMKYVIHGFKSQLDSNITYSGTTITVFNYKEDSQQLNFVPKKVI